MAEAMAYRAGRRQRRVPNWVPNWVPNGDEGALDRPPCHPGAAWSSDSPLRSA